MGSQKLPWTAKVKTFKHAEGVEEIVVCRAHAFPSLLEIVIFGSNFIFMICAAYYTTILTNAIAFVLSFSSFQVLRSVKEESLLLCTDLGIQLTRRSYIGSSQSVFVEHHKVEDVILNEGITFSSVQTYLAFMIQVSFSISKLLLSLFKCLAACRAVKP